MENRVSDIVRDTIFHTHGFRTKETTTGGSRLGRTSAPLACSRIPYRINLDH
jgi:hypothetical protein